MLMCLHTYLVSRPKRVTLLVQIALLRHPRPPSLLRAPPTRLCRVQVSRDSLRWADSGAWRQLPPKELTILLTRLLLLQDMTARHRLLSSAQSRLLASMALLRIILVELLRPALLLAALFPRCAGKAARVVRLNRLQKLGTMFTGLAAMN